MEYYFFFSEEVREEKRDIRLFEITT